MKKGPGSRTIGKRKPATGKRLAVRRKALPLWAQIQKKPPQGLVIVAEAGLRSLRGEKAIARKNGWELYWEGTGRLAVEAPKNKGMTSS